MQLLADLGSRIEEIDIYFDFAKDIDGIETHRQKEFQLTSTHRITVKRDLQKVIRANCYLLLYNLIEATIRECIWTICDAISDSGLVYGVLSHTVQNVWLKERVDEIREISNPTKIKNYIKKFLEENKSTKGISLSKERVSLNGNLDLRSIEKIIIEYGFHGRISIKDKLQLGKALLRVKNERNALAHGNKSFRKSAEVVTMSELMGYKDLIVIYMNDIVNNAISYIENESYKNKMT